LSSSFFLPPKLKRLLRLLPLGDSSAAGDGERDRLLRGAGLEAPVCRRSGETARKEPPLGLPAGGGMEGLRLRAAGSGEGGWCGVEADS
jgi:hypothetical protein